MKLNSIKKCIAISLLFIMMFSFSGCSEFLKEIAIEKVTDYVESVMTDFVAAPFETIEVNSLATVELTELTSEQSSFALDNLSGVKTSVKKVKMNDDRTKAEVTINFNDVVDFYDDTDLIADIESLELFFADCDSISCTLNFTVERQKNGWKFADMSVVDEIFFAPYADVCVLDDNGYPLNITPGYVNSIFVDSFWYDPIQGDPTNATSFNDAHYLQHVFYFNQPMTMSFTAELIKDDEVIDSYEITLVDSVIATCDFEKDDVSAFASGSYVIALSFNGEVVVASDAITVR